MSLLKSTSPVVLSSIVAPVSSPVTVPVISFLLKVTVVGAGTGAVLGVLYATTVRPSVPVKVTVLSDAVEALSVTLPSFIVNVDVVNLVYSVSPILSVAVSSRV